MRLVANGKGAVREEQKNYTVKDTVSHALSPFLSSQIICVLFSLLPFPNINKYSWRAKYVPRTRRHSYEKDIMSDLRKIKI